MPICVQNARILIDIIGSEEPEKKLDEETFARMKKHAETCVDCNTLMEGFIGRLKRYWNET